MSERREGGAYPHGRPSIVQRDTLADRGLCADFELGGRCKRDSLVLRAAYAPSKPRQAPGDGSLAVDQLQPWAGARDAGRRRADTSFRARGTR